MRVVVTFGEGDEPQRGFPGCCHILLLDCAGVIQVGWLFEISSMVWLWLVWFSFRLQESFLNCGFIFSDFSYLPSMARSKNIKCKIPKISNSFILTCESFWAVWWNLAPSRSIPPGMWLIPLSRGSTLYMSPNHQSLSSRLGYRVNCCGLQCLCSCNLYCTNNSPKAQE